MFTLSHPRMINLKFLLQPHLKYNITQWEEGRVGRGCGGGGEEGRGGGGFGYPGLIGSYKKWLTTFCSQNLNFIWKESLHVCQIQIRSTLHTVTDCGRPPVPIHGKLISLTKTTYEGEVVFECHKTGYELIGAKVRRCLTDGTWSGTLASCERESFRLPLVFRPLSLPSEKKIVLSSAHTHNCSVVSMVLSSMTEEKYIKQLRQYDCRHRALLGTLSMRYLFPENLWLPNPDDETLAKIPIAFPAF